MLSIAARSVPLVVRDGLSVFFCGRLCGWYPSAGSAKCNPRVFVEGGPGALLALPQRSIQCNAETKYKHARPVLFVRSGMACGWKICNGGMMVSCGGCCPSVCCFLSTHMCSFWHFVRIPCNVDIIGYLLSGSLLVSQPFCQPFTPNSKTVPSEQIYTRKY